MPPVIVRQLNDELGTEDVERVTRTLEHFNWDLVAMLTTRSKEFIAHMRKAYSMNTRRIYCTKLSRVFSSQVMRDLFPSDNEFEDVQIKWKCVRRAINAEMDERESYADIGNINITELPGVPDSVYKDALLISQSALRLIEERNTAAAFRFMIQKYIETRSGVSPNAEDLSAPFTFAGTKGLDLHSQ